MSRPSSSRRALMPLLKCCAGSRRARRRAGCGSSRTPSTAAWTASSYCSSVAWNVAPAGSSGLAGLWMTSGSGDSTQRPARKIGCGLAPVVVVMESAPRACCRRVERRRRAWTVILGSAAGHSRRWRPSGHGVRRGGMADTTAGEAAARPARVKPGSRVKLADFDPEETFGHTEEADEEMAKGLDAPGGASRSGSTRSRSTASSSSSRASTRPARTARSRHVMTGFNPAGVTVVVVQGPVRGRARPRLPLARPPAHAGQGRDRDLQPLPLRGGARRPGPFDFVPQAVWRRRYDQINALSGCSPTKARRSQVLPVISPEEQLQRFQDRIDDPDKRWKFKSADLDERKLWDKYMAAFEDALSRCSTGLGARGT